MNIRHILLAMVFLSFVLTAGCGEADRVSERHAAVVDNEKEFVIGLGYTQDKWCQAFADGAILRAEEINSKGGVNGRTIKVVVPGYDITKPATLGQAMVDIPDMGTIITRLDGTDELPVAVMMEYNGMVMLSGARDGNRLLDLGFGNIFHAMPDVKALARGIIAFCKKNKIQHIAVLNGPSDFQRALADAFELAALDMGIDVPERIPLNGMGRVKIRGVGRLQNEDENAQAILLVVDRERLVETIKALRREKLDIPVILGPESVDGDLLEDLKDKAGKLYAVTTYAPIAHAQRIDDFRTAFKKKYGKDPVNTASEGYDTMAVLLEALRESGSPDPDSLVRALQSLSGFDGVNGILTFSGNDLLVDEAHILGNQGVEWVVEK